MHGKNLSIIFAPNFLRPKEETADTMIGNRRSPFPFPYVVPVPHAMLHLGDANYAHALVVSLIARPEIYFIEQNTNIPKPQMPSKAESLLLGTSGPGQAPEWSSVRRLHSLITVRLSLGSVDFPVRKAVSRPAIPKELFDVRFLLLLPIGP